MKYWEEANLLQGTETASLSNILAYAPLHPPVYMHLLQSPLP